MPNTNQDQVWKDIQERFDSLHQFVDGFACNPKMTKEQVEHFENIIKTSTRLIKLSLANALMACQYNSLVNVE